MIDDIFYWIVNMSVMGSITGIIIYLICKVKALPRRFVHFLWIIPTIRFIIPFSFGGEINLMQLLNKLGTKTIILFENKEGKHFLPGEILATNFAQAADTYFPITYKTNLLENVFNISAFVWLTITLALIFTLFTLYFMTKAELKGASHIDKNVYSSDAVTSPAVYGILKPRIIIPASYSDKDLKYILAHENTHIKRLDNLWRMVAFIIASFHWFNPLSWFFLKSFLENIELACDEKVLSKYTDDERKAYALSLVECAEHKTLFASAFGGAKVRLRIESILSYRKLSIFATFALILFVLCIAYVLLTNAK